MSRTQHRRLGLQLLTSLLIAVLFASAALGGIATSPLGVKGATVFAGLGSCPLGLQAAGISIGDR